MIAEKSNPYSKVVRAGDFVFVSGHVSAAADFEAQMTDCILHLSAALSRAGSSLDEVVRVGVFLRDRADFQAMNAVYETHFVAATLPTRTTISGIDFTKPTTLVELDCVAYSPQG